MIERDNSTEEMSLRCDLCTNETEIYGRRGFDKMISDAKEAGWKIKTDHAAEGGWSHVCPDHKTDRRDAQRKLLGL